MGKKCYIGVNGVARRVKRIYLGVNNVAHKVKKAYIGVGGVARPCFTSEEVVYYGTVTSLSEAKRFGSATKVGNYALFGGGYNGSSDSAVVNAYDENFTRYIPSSLSVARSYLSGVTVDNYGLFAGGRAGSSNSNVVDAYSTNLTRSAPSTLMSSRYAMGSATLRGSNTYGIFASGMGNVPDSVDYYRKDLVKGILTSLSVARYNLKGVTLQDYALFGGGYANNGISKVVDGYDTSLSRVIAPQLDDGKDEHASAEVGGYGLFASGRASNGNFTRRVNAYDNQLTMSIVASVSVARANLCGVSIGKFALFCGGFGTQMSDVVDAYDESLSLSVPQKLSVPRNDIMGTNIGRYGILAGGYDTSTTSLVEVYTYTD